MALATVFLPGSNQRKVVTVGGKDAADAFAAGFKLETPTQNAATYANPQREILQGQGNALIASDTGQQLPDTRSLSSMVGTGGYQDTRRNLDLSGTGNRSNSTTQTSTVNPSDSFNMAIANLLKGSQTNQADNDLMKQRNELIQQRFNNVNEQTPADNANLTPAQQSGLRDQRNSSLETSLTGVNTALQTREQQRKLYKDDLATALDVIDRQTAAAKGDAAAENLVRDDAQKSLKIMYDTFGSDVFKTMSSSDKRKWEVDAHIPPGTLDYAGQTVKEEAAQKGRYKRYAANKYGGAMTLDTTTGKYIDDTTGEEIPASVALQRQLNTPKGTSTTTKSSTTSASSGLKTKRTAAQNNILRVAGITDDSTADFYLTLPTAFRTYWASKQAGGGVFAGTVALGSGESMKSSMNKAYQEWLASTKKTTTSTVAPIIFK